MPALTLSQRLFDDADRSPIDPFSLFEEWFVEARQAELNDPHAMALATIDDAGVPDVRMVLLNARDQRGFAFFTNFKSRKAVQLLAHPAAALLFHWKSLRRQVRIRGTAEVVDAAEADAYFATRARASQIGAHASHQTQPLSARAELLQRVEALQQSFPPDQPVPRPAHWSGFRVVPLEFEFWKDGEYRLHDRVRFSRGTAAGEWSRQRLNP
ncbi:MAG TPA: pyridoxamine 5'-phosphate oxidase [Devosiaceae bacterium]|jgi:pyridoxamine 5'-phosphate oxidase|nr:pyridoxamine 5'-phosphate oxidase [Devosiaceae bacterium]